MSVRIVEVNTTHGKLRTSFAWGVPWNPHEWSADGLINLLWLEIQYGE